jgi:hypothetical protein
MFYLRKQYLAQFQSHERFRSLKNPGCSPICWNMGDSRSLAYRPPSPYPRAYMLSLRLRRMHCRGRRAAATYARPAAPDSAPAGSGVLRGALCSPCQLQHTRPGVQFDTPGTRQVNHPAYRRLSSTGHMCLGSRGCGPIGSSWHPLLSLSEAI